MFSLNGILVGLYASSHIIKSIVGINTKYFIMLFIVLFYILNIKILNLKIRKKNLFLILLFMGLLFYSFLTLTLFWNHSAFSSFFEMLLIIIFFFVGKNFRHNDYRAFFLVILCLSTIQSALLLLNRSYVLSNLDNYLLVTLILGVAAIVSFVNVFNEDQKAYTKILWVLLFILHIFAILNMQSRGTALFVFVFSIVYPFFILKGAKVAIYLLFITVSGSFAVNYLIEIYKKSILFTRMNDLFYNIEREPRLETYKLYFNAMKENWITGFGIGQSSHAIYGIQNDYPHNFILEFVSEFGVVGFSFIIILILYTFVNKKYYFNNEKKYYIMSVSFFLYMFFIFSKSFGIYDSYLLFLSFGFMWSFCQKKYL